jgi:alanyl-tRNA synthetase
MVSGNDLRPKYLAFFVKKGHQIIPTAPRVPENAPSDLFTTAGMLNRLLATSHLPA